jgi:hypothetical protein
MERETLIRIDSRASVGNDVVDLGHPRCTNRPSGDPFLRRILARGEDEWLERGGPDELRVVRLWALWAAKEAAFKVHSHLGFEPGKVFRPRSLVCELRLTVDGRAGGEFGLDGRVLLDGVEESAVRLEGTADADHVHVVGWSTRVSEAPPGWLEWGVERTSPFPDGEAALGHEMADLRGGFSADEWEGIRSPSSAHVRLLARTRIERHLRERAEEGSVEILTPPTGVPGLRRGPPRVWVGGRERSGVGVSLSHHGRYVAWAILLAPDPRSEHP